MLGYDNAIAVTSLKPSISVGLGEQWRMTPTRKIELQLPGIT
jgi:hypothetical protein